MARDASRIATMVQLVDTRVRGSRHKQQQRSPRTVELGVHRSCGAAGAAQWPLRRGLPRRMGTCVVSQNNRLVASKPHCQPDLRGRAVAALTGVSVSFGMSQGLSSSASLLLSTLEICCSSAVVGRPLAQRHGEVAIPHAYKAVLRLR
jgi:hypothetical protein